MYREIAKCRICGGDNLVSILNLGTQYLTGVFPKSKDQSITAGPLEMVKCLGGGDMPSCGLVQLKHSYDLHEMYGQNYGYRSSLNQSMIKHLNEKVKKIEDTIPLEKGDLVIDIGSNDSTLLRGYSNKDLLLVGVDATGLKFKDYYPEYIQLIPDFYSAEIIKARFGSRKAKVITSIAMFYDLEAPMEFMKQIYEVLADDGVWVFEQSYLPTMLEMNAYDTICHEHLEYYGLQQIQWMAERTGFKIIDVEFNSINGGSFSVMAAKSHSPFRENTSLIRSILAKESAAGLDNIDMYNQFKQRVFSHRDELLRFFARARTDHKRVFGYGASTKGNVVLQFCNLTERDIPCIADVNADKFGAYTPGTYIPIVSEEEARSKKPDYFLVLPWHFKSGIIAREQQFLNQGGRLIFPLPHIEIVGAAAK